MKRELKNGFIHASIAIIVLAPAAYFDNIIAWTAAGFYYGWIRETTEEQLKHPELSVIEAAVDAFESWRDLLGWLTGGFIVGLAVHFGQ